MGDTQKYVDSYSINNFQCNCFGFYNFNKKESFEKKFKSTALNSNNRASAISSLKSDSIGSESQEKPHRPTQEFLLKCLKTFQDLFDVECFLNVPTKMNDIYYKYGQLVNFKKAIQNIFNESKKSKI